MITCFLSQIKTQTKISKAIAKDKKINKIHENNLTKPECQFQTLTIISIHNNYTTASEKLFQWLIFSKSLNYNKLLGQNMECSFML